MKVTQWFDGDVKPVRAGVYEASFFGGLVYFFNWDGDHWGMGADTPAIAASRPPGFSNQPDMWRGLAEKP